MNGSSARLNVVDEALLESVRRLRAQNERVVIDLTDGRVAAGEQGCDRKLQQRDGAWTVTEV